MSEKISRYFIRKYFEVVERAAALEGVLPTSKKIRALSRLFLAGRIFWLRLSQNFLEFSIIVFLDPSESFNVLKKRDEFAVCTSSYVEYRLYSKKLKLLSLGGISAIVMTSLVVSLVTSYILPKYKGLAATYTFAQTNWTSADTTNFATDPTDRTGWTKFYSKNIATVTSTGAVTISSLIVGSDNTSTDFSSGTVSLTEINGSGVSAVVKLAVPE